MSSTTAKTAIHLRDWRKIGAAGGGGIKRSSDRVFMRASVDGREMIHKCYMKYKGKVFENKVINIIKSRPAPIRFALSLFFLLEIQLFSKKRIPQT
jgi:hypothetical protein